MVSRARVRRRAWSGRWGASPPVAVGWLVAALWWGAPLGAQAPSAAAPAVDASGVAAFWRAAARLARGEDLPAAAWDSLFATPGYAALAARERNRPALTRAFRAAFLPARRAERDSILAAPGGGGYVGRVIRHVIPLPGRRAALDSAAARVAAPSAAGGLPQAVARAQRFLPPGTTARLAPPRVALVFYVPDGSADTALVVADLAHVATQADPAGFFAHEAWHTYRNRLYLERRARERQDGAAPLTPGQAAEDLLGRLENEAIADLQDKAPRVARDSAALVQAEPDTAARAYLARYRAQLAEAPAQLARLNSVLARGTPAVTPAADSAASSAADAALKAGADSLVRTLPLGGRALGAYMAAAVRRALGDSALSATAGAPAAFALAYARAAARPECGCPALSARALATVVRLQPPAAAPGPASAGRTPVRR